MDEHEEVDCIDENKSFCSYDNRDPPHTSGDVVAELLMLHPHDNPGDTVRQTISHHMQEQTIHSVLYQIQQKHKPGRRFKKKTLMKMANLFVIAQGKKTKPTPDGPLAVNQKEAATSVCLVTSQSDTTDDHKHGTSDCNKETVVTTISALSGQTAKRKTSSTNKKQAKKKSGLFGTTASKKQRNLRKDRSLAFKGDTCDNGEVAEALPVTSSGGRDVMTAAETHNMKPNKSRTAVLESQRKHRKALKLTEETTGEQEPTVSQAPSRGKLRKQKTISPAACVRRTTGTTRSQLLAPKRCNAEAVSVPPCVTTIKTEAAWEPVTPTLTKRRKPRRQRKKKKKQESDPDAASHDNVTNSQTKNEQMKNKADQDETTDAGKEEIQMWRKLNGNISKVKEDDMKITEGKKKHLGGRRRAKVGKRGTKAAPVLHNVSSAPPVSPVNEKLQQEASQRRCKGVKSEPSPVSTRRGRMKTDKASRTKRGEDSGNEPLLETYNMVDLNAVKEEQSEITIQEVESEGRALRQDKISLVDRKRSRTKKTSWTRKKQKQPGISAQCLNPASGDDGGSYVELRHTKQTQTDNSQTRPSHDPKTHRPQHQNLKSPKPLRCRFCGRSFRHITAFTLHQRIHTGEKPYRCPTCGKSFPRLAQVKAHSEIHRGPREVRCPSCGGRFQNKDELIAHFHVHVKGTESSTGAEDTRGKDANDKQVGNCLDPPALTGIWTEPAAPEILDDQSSPPGEDQAAEAGEPEVTHLQSPPAANHPNPSVNGDSDVSVSPGRTSRLRPPSFIRTPCGRCLKSFSRRNKLRLLQRVHGRTSRPFSCAHCELEFRFLASYVDHLRERASHSPYACALCGETFTDTGILSVHFSECHEQQGHNKCDTCGKIFCNLGNLKKHKLLHKRVNSHFCLACNLTFSSNGALKNHLKTHRPSLSVPQPAGRVEPLLFPYHCKRCDAKFSSADLLHAHQVCHFTAGNQSETRGVFSASSQPPRRLPVSNKKHLFRYPHPDRLYVVPALSAEPPVVISDTEEEASQTDSHVPQNQEESQQDLDCGAGDGDWSGAEPRDDAHRCALCKEAFTDVSKLHEHYMDHARGV